VLNDKIIEEAIKKFIDNLKENYDNLPEVGIKMKTPKRNDIFYVYKNKKRNVFIKPLNGKSEFPQSMKAIKKYILYGKPTHPVYTVSIGDYIKENFIKEESISPIPNPKERKMNTKNIILYGSPGVGKTHNTNKLISLIESGWSEKEIFEIIKDNKFNDDLDIIRDRVKFVTFHQSFGYEDFIEGFRPNIEGNIVLSDGIFKTICKEANEDKENNYYLVIDEINRGNISKIFGELITLLEEDKRDKLEVTLPYSKKPFKIPSNLYIIGTMNSTDKSIALIDIALRRRFTFLKMKPNAELIEYDKAKGLFIELNEYIKNSHLGEDYQIGHSYFMGIKDNDDLDFVWEYKIKPLLEEYFYGDNDNLQEVLKIKI